MIDEGAFLALLTIWLGLVCVTAYYMVRIALLLRGQRIMENAYRLRLAVLRGKAVQEAAGANVAPPGEDRGEAP